MRGLSPQHSKRQKSHTAYRMDGRCHTTISMIFKDLLAMRLLAVDQPVDLAAHIDKTYTKHRSENMETITDAPSQQHKPTDSFRLSALPPEIRGQVYSCMVDINRADHLNFLLTSRAILRDAHQTLYQRPLHCVSQDALIAYINRRPQYLHHIQHLSLQLREISPEKMEPFLAQVAMSLTPKKQANPYVTERDRLFEALRKLPHLRHITISRPKDGSQAAPKVLMNVVLEQLAQTHPRLQSLRVDNDEFNIRLLANFKLLQSLTVNGFSKTSPKQIVDSFASMSQLRNLQMIGPPPGTKWRARYLKCQNSMSFASPAAVQQVPGLQSLHIFEHIDPKQPKAVLLTVDMLKAVCRKHAHSLEDLTVSSTSTPPDDILAFVGGLLMSAAIIYRLTLSWPGMAVDTLDSLPSTVRRLEVAVSAPGQADAFLARLSLMSHKLPYLQGVKLMLINGVVEVPTQAEGGKASQPVAFGMPVIMPLAPALGTYPWEVKWGIWQPVPVE